MRRWTVCMAAALALLVLSLAVLGRVGLNSAGTFLLFLLLFLAARRLLLLHAAERARRLGE